MAAGVERPQARVRLVGKGPLDSVTIELYPDQVAFLRRMVETHHLFDVSKAVRVLITYARQDGYAAGIYGKIRCTMC